VPAPGAPATVVAGDYAGSFDPASAGRGHFEVIGTLQQDGTLRAAQVVALGDNFGARLLVGRIALCRAPAPFRGGRSVAGETVPASERAAALRLHSRPAAAALPQT